MITTNKAKSPKRKKNKPGQGRKPKYGSNMVRLSARIPQYQMDHLLRVGGGKDVSEALRIIIEKDIDDANSN